MDQFIDERGCRSNPATRSGMQDHGAVLDQLILEVIDRIVEVTLPELLEEALGLVTYLHAGILLG